MNDSLKPLLPFTTSLSHASCAHPNLENAPLKSLTGSRPVAFGGYGNGSAKRYAGQLKHELRLRLRPHLKYFSCPFSDRVRFGVPLRHAGDVSQ
jgi:hypothetical protein